MLDLNQKSYDAVLTEADNFFRAQGLCILGEGYKEIASNTALFESYVDQLTAGCPADDAATMAQLMVNTNANILRESSMTGIQPVASLSMPVIRKLWPKFALKEAIANEVAKTPRFVITYTAPYMFRANENGEEERVYIPQDLKRAKIADEMPDHLKKVYTAVHVVSLEAGAAKVVDFTYTDGVSDPKDAAVWVANTGSALKAQPLDELVFEAVELGEKTKDAAALPGKKYYNENGEVVAFEADKVYEGAEVKIGKKLGVYGNGQYALSDGGMLIVQFDGANRKATFAAVGKKVVLHCKAGVSSEYNETSWDVGFDIKRQDIDIPTGQHINAPLPIEALNDMMALYQIDGTKETVDLMTNVFAQKLDLEVLNFLKKSHLNQPSNEAFFNDKIGFPGVDEYTFAFDCKPAAGFAGSPKAWREEIKPVIDHLAQKIKNNTYLQAGVFTIIGNPLDIQILANVDWQFRGGQGGNMDGVDVDYSVGTYVGANTYKVVASTNVPVGQLFVIFTPSGNTQMTYKLFNYVYQTEYGYIDPNRSRTPSIMMTARYTMHEFMPAIGCIVILNNDGKGQFAEYTNWKEVK